MIAVADVRLRWGEPGTGRPCRVRGNGVVEIETCTGTWLFEVPQSRFCRVPLGTSPAFVPPSAWRPYERLALSADGGVRVILDASAHTGISGWLHDRGCDRCSAEAIDLRVAG